MQKLGFSTGCLYKHYSVQDTLKIFKTLNLDYVEMGFATYEQLVNCDVKELESYSDSFREITIHAPCIGVKYFKGNETKDIFNRLTLLNNALKAISIVFHPDTIEDFSVFDKCSFNVSLENMDIRKTKGLRPEEFERFKSELDFTFVLDIQHAYEHDPSMQLASEFYDCMKNQISHFHISGQNENLSHSLVKDSVNKERILDFYFEHKRVLTIEEGVLSENYNKEIDNELMLFYRGVVKSVSMQY